ncbi:Hint domain-containing protein [Methylobacterium sp. JK268]
MECFTRGTRLLTPTGERCIEDLAVGDRVLTAEGEARPIIWIGRRRLDLRAHPRPDLVWPVRIRAGAVAPGLPVRDLLLSPGHGVAFDGHLIPAGSLVDGAAVTVCPRGEIEYFHLELDLHAVVLAEGLPCESFLDGGQRADFEGGGPVMRLHPVFLPLTYEAACLPVAIGGPVVAAARARIAARAAEQEPAREAEALGMAAGGAE